MVAKKQVKGGKKPASKGAVNTGGGAYVGGNVKAKEFVGRDKIVTQTAVAPGQAEREALIAALRDLHARVEALELEAWEKEEIAGNLKTAEKMVEAKEPPKEKLVDKLTTTQKMLEAAKGSIEAAKGIGAAVSLATLAAKAGEALQMAQQWLAGLPHP
jgi:hypothetical protein